MGAHGIIEDRGGQHEPPAGQDYVAHPLEIIADAALPALLAAVNLQTGGQLEVPQHDLVYPGPCRAGPGDRLPQKFGGVPVAAGAAVYRYNMCAVLNHGVL